MRLEIDTDPIVQRARELRNQPVDRDAPVDDLAVRSEELSQVVIQLKSVEYAATARVSQVMSQEQREAGEIATRARTLAEALEERARNINQVIYDRNRAL